MWSRIVSLQELLAYLTRILDSRGRGAARLVMLEVGNGNHYVQLYFNGHAVYGEAVGSHSFVAEGRPALSKAQRETLTWLGWESPSKDDPALHANYFREWSNDTPTEAIVMDIARTIASVYMQGEGDRIELHRSWYESGDSANQIPA